MRCLPRRSWSDADPHPHLAAGGLPTSRCRVVRQHPWATMMKGDWARWARKRRRMMRQPRWKRGGGGLDGGLEGTKEGSHETLIISGSRRGTTTGTDGIAKAKRIQNENGAGILGGYRGGRVPAGECTRQQVISAIYQHSKLTSSRPMALRRALRRGDRACHPPCGDSWPVTHGPNQSELPLSARLIRLTALTLAAARLASR